MKIVENMENQNTEIESTIKKYETPWYKKIEISVEPTMSLYMFAFMLTSVVEQAYFLRRSCLVNLNYTKEICDNLDDHMDIKKEVQEVTTNFHQWNNIAGHVFPIVLSLFLGAWSDKRGRKFPLLMGLTGKFIYSIMFIVNTRQESWPVEYITYTATIPCALTGADVAIFASCFTYISDLSTTEHRTIRITILDICYLAMMPTGVALGSHLFNHVFHKSYTILFTINASLIAIAIIYSLLVLKWQTTSKQRSLRELSVCGFFPDFFDINHALASLRILTRKRQMHRRLFLGIFMISMALYTFQRDEKPFLYLYTNWKYQWGVEQYSNFKTFQSAAYCIMMLIAIPLMSKVFKWKDTVIILIGSTCHSIARLFYIFAPTTFVFYIGSAFCSLGPICGPVLRSMTSKVVPQTERGKVFALLSVCDNAVPFISGVLYAQVYKATLGQMGGIFWLTFATQATVFTLMMIIHIILRGRSLAVPEEEGSENTLVHENGEKMDVNIESPEKDKH